MAPVLIGVGSFLIQKALELILKRVFGMDWGKLNKVKDFVLEAETLPLPGKSDDSGPDKDSWVRGKVLQDPEFRDTKAHVIDWLVGTAVALLKKGLIK